MTIGAWCDTAGGDERERAESGEKPNMETACWFISTRWSNNDLRLTLYFADLKYNDGHDSIAKFDFIL